MAVQSIKKQEKELRNKEIKSLYGSLMSDPETQKFAAYEMLAFKFGISATSVCRIVGNLKSK